MSMQIAQTIISQINALDRWAMGAWGAKERVAMKDGLKFKTSGMVRWKGYVYIKLNGRDLYDVMFFRIRGVEMKIDKEVKDIYADMLVDVINDQVG